MATDEYLIDVRADEQQQQIRGALEAEPRTKLRLRYQEVQHRAVALCTPALVDANGLGHVRIAVWRHARNEVQRRYPPGDFARTCHHVARRLIKVWLCCQPAKPGLLVRGERLILAHDREVVGATQQCRLCVDLRWPRHVEHLLARDFHVVVLTPGFLNYRDE